MLGVDVGADSGIPAVVVGATVLALVPIVPFFTHAKRDRPLFAAVPLLVLVGWWRGRLPRPGEGGLHMRVVANGIGIEVVGAVIPSQTTQAQPSAGETAKLSQLRRRSCFSPWYKPASTRSRRPACAITSASRSTSAPCSICCVRARSTPSLPSACRCPRLVALTRCSSKWN